MDFLLETKNFCLFDFLKFYGQRNYQFKDSLRIGHLKEISAKK